MPQQKGIEMPFDGTGFPPRREEPNRPAPGDNAVSIVIIAIAFSLLVMPFSMGGFVDIIRYFRGS